MQLYIYICYILSPVHLSFLLSFKFKNFMWAPPSCLNQSRADAWQSLSPPPLFVWNDMVTSPPLLGDVTPLPMQYAVLAVSDHLPTPFPADSGHLRPPFHPHSSPLFLLYTWVRVDFPILIFSNFPIIFFLSPACSFGEPK